MISMIRSLFRPVRFKRLVLLALLLWAWVVLVLLLVIDAYGRVDRAQQADVIVVLGAGLRRNNTPGPALTRRAARAVELWRAGYAPIIICTGGKPGNRTRSEADACAELVRAAGIPADAILLEDRSRSTEENALETYTLMQANNWQSAIVVSDSFHLFRALRLFRNEGLLIFTSPAANSPPAREYVVFLAREVVAFHWQLLKEAFSLSTTYVQGI
jgi:uncharacterized SAM-binding protein YcdF (DUF218 family)